MTKLLRAKKRKWNELGSFTYHHVKVLFLASDDESVFVVKIWDGNHHQGIKRPKPTQVERFKELRLAREHFDNATYSVVNHTTLTAVTLFMEQGVYKRERL